MKGARAKAVSIKAGKMVSLPLLSPSRPSPPTRVKVTKLDKRNREMTVTQVKR